MNKINLKIIGNAIIGYNLARIIISFFYAISPNWKLTQAGIDDLWGTSWGIFWGILIRSIEIYF